MIDWGMVAADEWFKSHPYPHYGGWRGYCRSEHTNSALNFMNAVRERVANLGRCLRDAGMLATLEHRMFSAFAAPLVIRVDPDKESEIRERIRALSGVGMIVDAYKRCRHVWRGISAPLAMRGKRCGLEDGHPGAHTIYGRSEEDAS